MAKRRDRVELMQERLQVEVTRLLCYIDDAEKALAEMSAGKIYSPAGAKAVKKLDALTGAERALSLAVRCLDQALEKAEEKAANG